MDFSALGQVFNTFKNKISELPQQFQAGYELLKPTIQQVTLPVGQAVQGVQQRINNPYISNPVSPIERSILNSQQQTFNNTKWEQGGDMNQPIQPRELTPQERNIDTFYENTYPGEEKTTSASPIDIPRAVSTIPALMEVRNRALGVFTPMARFQLGGVPFGVESPFGPAGTEFGPASSKTITMQESALNQPDEQHIAVHELLHAAARGLGGIPWDQFVRDYTSLLQSHQGIANHFQQLDTLHQTSPEEIYAELGAFLGPNIFNTPMGKYYEGILQKPSDKKIPIRKKK